MYKLFRSLFFLLEAEKAHYLAMNALRWICKIPFGKKMIASLFTPQKAESIQLLNLNFRNKVGLAAGFDKNARYLTELETLGFGFVEIGTVTPKPQEGNPKPRLFRLKKDKALINRMGFNNDGVEEVAKRLKNWRYNNTYLGSASATQLIIGGNIGKNKMTPNENAWQDYVTCFEALHPYVDYFVVNVSSPNTPGLRELQEKESLRIIFEKLTTLNVKLDKPKPILLKIAPDLSKEQVDDVIELVREIKISGLVVSNTTLDRTMLSNEGKVQAEKIGNGGLSGQPVRAKSTNLIEYIHTKSEGAIFMMGSGGVFNKEDVKSKLKAGAQLIQIWTGFIYEGPGIIKKLV